MPTPETDTITATERTPDGAVEVTVAASGALLNITCSELIRTMPPPQVAATIQHCVRAAQASATRKLNQLRTPEVA